MSSDIKPFGEFLQEGRGSEKEMKKWVFDQILNTNKRHDEIKKEFIRKFGASNVKYFEKYVEEAVD